MPTQFTQKHFQELPVSDLTPEEFINVAVETSKSFGWTLSNINQTGFIAYTNNGIFNWNAEIKVKVNNGSANLLSQSRNIRKVEFDKDKANIENFILKFNDLKASLIIKEEPALEEAIPNFHDLQSNFAA